MSLESIHNINLDMSVPRLQNIRCVSDDKDSRIVNITLTENGKPYWMSEDVKIYCKIHKPDNTKIYINESDTEHLVRNEEKKTVTVVFNDNATAFHGVARCELQLFDKTEEKVLSTMSFNVIVDKSVIENSDIESTDEFSALNDLILHEKDRIEIVEELDKTVTENESVRNQNEDVRQSNEIQREENEDTRIVNENARKSAEITRDNAEIVREQNEATRKSQEETRQTNELSRKTSETNRVNAETSRTSDETTRQTNEDTRKNAETVRDTNENERIINENARKSNETTRVNNENNRKSAETSRETNFADMQDDTNTAISNANTATSNANTATTNANTATDRANKAAKDCEDIVSGAGLVVASEKGQPNGVATLDENAKVPASQLPSYVDDVIEGVVSEDEKIFTNIYMEIVVPEEDKIYVDVSTNKTYRWSGTKYTTIGNDLALGENQYSAYRGDRGKIAYDHSQDAHARTDATKVEDSITNGNIKINGTETNVYTHPTQAEKTSNLYKITTNNTGHVTGATAVVKSDIVNLGIPDQDTTYNVVSKTENGLVPMLPNESMTTKYLRQDGTWQVPPDTNTWRGIQNNLTSTSTTDSLAAAQGKALNDKITTFITDMSIVASTSNTEVNVSTNIQYLQNYVVSGTSNLLNPVASGVYVQANCLAILEIYFQFSGCSKNISFGYRDFTSAEYNDYLDRVGIVDTATYTPIFSRIGTFKGGRYIRPIFKGEVAQGKCTYASVRMIALKKL